MKRFTNSRIGYFRGLKMVEQRWKIHFNSGIVKKSKYQKQDGGLIAQFSSNFGVAYYKFFVKLRIRNDGQKNENNYAICVAIQFK